MLTISTFAVIFYVRIEQIGGNFFISYNVKN
jgi:hypothetical protein